MATRRYVREKENLMQQRGWTDLEMEASKLKKSFITKFIADFDTNLYKT